MAPYPAIFPQDYLTLFAIYRENRINRAVRTYLGKILLVITDLGE